MRTRRAVVALAVLAALGACSTPSDSADVEDPASSTESAAAPDDATTAPGPGGPDTRSIEFRPVLSGPQPCDRGEAVGTTLPSEEAASAEAGCYAVGPSGFDDTDLDRAEAIQGGSTGTEWVVEIEVTTGSRTIANEQINACVSGDATCPTGMMAIVIDGAVVSAPQVNEPNLADEPFVISGGGADGFSRDEAEALAERIGS